MPNEEKSRGNYRTAAYTAVLDYMKSQGDRHLTVFDVTEGLREAGKIFGQTTVYRQMLRLTEEGFIQKMPPVEGGSACYRYAGNCHSDHYHLLCSVCGGLTHLTCDCFSDLYHHVGSEHGFHIDGSRTVFYGVCAACYRAGKHKNSGDNQ